MSVAEAKHRALGLTDSELERICALIEREPNDLELVMFSLLWSEHCAYKHSRKLLRQLPSEGEAVLVGPGENAGAVDIGGGWAIAFKAESHNHPSAVEPFQGAATGVGGILRDIFALGARPIAVLDSLRFGELSSERSRYLLDGAVRGIGHYGNSIGVPTVGGEIGFDRPYEQNCLINVMCAGLVRADRILRSAATGVGNSVVLMGASTGRDGIGGASVLASAELEETGQDKRPAVQIGDPFEESKLLECCLELTERGLLQNLQDLGAAGLTSASAEMASKGGLGIDIAIDRVPLRESDMEPFEIMVSESQERMLAVVEPARLEEALEVCARWETGAAEIGALREEPRLRVIGSEGPLADLPLEALVDGCPLYDLHPSRPARWSYPNEQSLAGSAGAGETLLALLSCPEVGSKRWAYQQYDSIVGSRTVRRPGAADAAVLQIPEAGSAIALSIDGNGRRVACDPEQGTIEAVLESAANLACVGARPLGLTNCLNFGNPEKPEVADQLERSVAGLASACEALGIPVVGGNVSLYNETSLGPIYPTPIVGLVGELPDPGRGAGIAWQEGDRIYLLGSFRPALAGSMLAKLRGELDHGLSPIDLDAARSAMELVRDGVRGGLIRSAHDIGDGGLCCALLECAIAAGLGAVVELDPKEPPLSGLTGDVALFGEGPGGYVIGGPAGAMDELADLAEGVPLLALGEVGGERVELSIRGDSGGGLNVAVAEAERAWSSLEERLAH